MPKNVSRNPLSPEPPYAHHRPRDYYAGKSDPSLFKGVHTTGSFDVAAAYAIATAKSLDNDFKKIYPVVLELDVTGLKALPDYDAIQQADIAFDSHVKKELERDLAKGRPIWQISDYWDGDRNSEVSEGDDPSGLIFENAVHANPIRAILDFVNQDEDAAAAILVSWLETGQLDEEILTHLVDQRRYMAHFDVDRLISVAAVKPYWSEILDMWDSGPKAEEKTERVEAAGWQAVTLEDFEVGVDSKNIWQNSSLPAYLFDSKREKQFHGTSSKYTEEAFGISLPVNPYPVRDPWGKDDEDGEDDDDA